MNDENPTPVRTQPQLQPLAAPNDSTGPESRTAPACGCGGASAKAPPSAFVYAIGRIEARFATLSAEREFAQVAGRENPEQTKGVTDQGLFHKILSDRGNRYLARQLCWVFSIAGLETYLLYPRDPVELDLLVDAIRPEKSPLDMDVVIGIRGSMAPPEMCNGLMVPLVGFDQIYSFDRESLLGGLPKAGKDSEKSAAEVLDRIIDMSDNAGTTDEHRALNYLAVRDPGLYRTTFEAIGRNSSVSSVSVQTSPLSGTRKVMDVIVTYTNRTTGVDELFCIRVDVTEEFPFLVKRITPYYGH